MAGEGSRSIIPWNIMEVEYVSGMQQDQKNPKRHTVESIARKYGVSVAAVKKKSHFEKWGKKRIEHDGSSKELYLNTLKNDRINKIIAFDDNTLTAAQMLQSISMQKLLKEDKVTGAKSLNVSIKTAEFQKISNVILTSVSIRRQSFGDLADNSQTEGISDFTNMMRQLRQEHEDSKGDS